MLESLFQYEIIEGRGYIANQYIVKTDDNYYLTLYRIRSRNTPANSSKKVVFLQHGLFDSAHTWINNLANQSLGFILADAGYDVFLGNSRGSTYSRGHAHLDPKYAKYWAFSYDEMVKFDLPTSINFVVKEAGLEKVFYVGHSQVSLSLTLLIFSYYLGEYLILYMDGLYYFKGAGLILTQLNTKNSLRSRIIAVASLAPAIYLNYSRSLASRFVQFCSSRFFVRLLTAGQSGELLPSNWLTRFLADTLCRSGNDRDLPFLCSNLLFLIMGYNKANLNAVSWTNVFLF